MRARTNLSFRVAATTLAIAAPLSCSSDLFYEALSPSPTVRLPRDEAPHRAGGGEWWYYTGMLSDAKGRGFGVEVVVFQIPEIPYLLNLARARIAQFAVLDLATGRFVYDQTREFLPVPVVGPSQPGFELATELVQISGHDGQDRVRAAMSDAEFLIDLSLTDARGPVLHGGRGYVPFGASGRAFYYSRPRMAAEGTLQVDGDRLEVTGSLWFDHQWGNDLTNPWLAWDWFSIRLDNGTDLMLYIFPDTTGPVLLGSYMPAEGATVGLSRENVAITPTSYWTSAHTGVTYPVAWRIEVPDHGLDLSLAALIDNQELDAHASTMNVYWEGLCEVAGLDGDRPAEGIAYVEMPNH